MSIVLIAVVIALILGAVVAFESLATPQFLLSVNQIVLPSSVAYFADLFQIPAGMAIIVSAYIFRFVLRRIPFIG